MSDIKEIYKNYSDKIFDKRFNSRFPIRRYVHRQQYYSILKYIQPGQNVLDAGCGEGVLSILMAKKGANVTACDISHPNIENAKTIAKKDGLDRKIKFIKADAENLPFQDNFFDVVISSHVLEHLPNFEKGLSEIYRTTKKKAIIALPTSLGLCGLALLGGGGFWYISKRSIVAPIIGFFRVLVNIFNDGVNEGYAGNKKLPHLRRHPWIVKKEIKRAGFKIIKYEAPSLCFPYFNFLLPFSNFLERFKDKFFFRNLGHGIIVVVEK